MSEKISLARLCYPVRALGPGDRVGIWTTGCGRSCPGCISPELRDYDVSREISIEAVLSVIRGVKGRIDGFTVSGGEPFYRPAALAELLCGLREMGDDILVFTGYTLEELLAMRDSDVDRALDACCVLIDGAYREELNDGKGLRGSSNQRIHVFRHRERYAGAENWPRVIQNILYGGSLLQIGMPYAEKKI